MATVAAQQAEAGQGKRPFLHGKRFSAQFYFDKVLPESEALLTDIVSGKGDMMDLEDAYRAA